MDFADAVFEDVNAARDPRSKAAPTGSKETGAGFSSRALVRSLLRGIEGEPVNANIQTMTTKGVCLLIEARLVAGSEFVLLMPRAGISPVELLCCVKKCEPGVAGRASFAITAFFKRILSRR
jgi:hypothetical protein